MKVIEVAAFVGTGLLGNPAGVCILDSPLEEAEMQETAARVGHAETAFLWPEGDDWRLRWFTPVVEVDLCGHATLASAWVLAQEGKAGGLVTFNTRSGKLTAQVESDGAIVLDFPALVPEQCPLPASIADLTKNAIWTGRSRDDWFAAFPSADDVCTFIPDMEAIAEAGLRGLIITAPGEGNWDVVSRFFAPQSGVPEDHVTGSAHCAIGPYWRPEGGELLCLQASTRGGELRVKVVGDRVFLKGFAKALE
jgi:predicted PhzF superfamily epimerase YddE/YHI9